MLEKLKHPPIQEVGAGFLLGITGALDAIVGGAYGLARHAEFPRRETSFTGEAHVDAAARHVKPVLRTLLFDAHDTWVLQIAANRFFVNWRRGETSTDYPRFSAEGTGVRDRTLREWEQLGAFLQQHGRHVPEILAAEVLKVDSLRWDDSVAQLLPSVGSLLGVAAGGGISGVNVTLNYTLDDVKVLVVVQGPVAPPAGESAPRLQLLTQATCLLAAGEAPRAGLDRANRAVNEVFDRMIPREQRAIHFGTEDT